MSITNYEQQLVALSIAVENFIQATANLFESPEFTAMKQLSEALAVSRSELVQVARVITITGTRAEVERCMKQRNLQGKLHSKSNLGECIIEEVMASDADSSWLSQEQLSYIMLGRGTLAQKVLAVQQLETQLQTSFNTTNSQ